MNVTPKTMVSTTGRIAGTLLAVLCALLALTRSSTAQQALNLTPDPPADGTALQSADSGSIWENGVGEGLRCGLQSFTVSAGGTYGVTAIGSVESHDLVLGSLTYGVVMYNTLNRQHWYRGNLEFRVQVFGGVQYKPRNEYLVALTPHLRYDFMTGSRWIPYIDVGAGVSATSIREPDLGGEFQFNLQANVGLQRFLTDNVALSLQAGYLHVSSAGIYEPNLGVNCVTGMLGVSFFF